MNIQLYVYDLSQGLARTASAAFLGVQIDAVYHTAIVFEGVEYLYDGGIKTVAPGKTHLGPPMQVLNLGKTDLPMDVIMDYLESLKEIYTAEAYDLWTHNCNNFSNDFATFLLGKGIPQHITNLPQTVLDSPFGRLIQPQINDMMRVRRTAHARRNGGLLGVESSVSAPKTHQQLASAVKSPMTAHALDALLAEAKRSCVVVFFTSSNCAPCRTLYPLFDELAAEAAHKATYVKIDVSRCYDIGVKYNVRSTPTFMTYLHGKEENRWSSSDPAVLRGNVKMLLQIAHPTHPHQSLNLPILHGAATKPVLYSRTPPLDKLKAKMGPSSKDPAVAGVIRFVAARLQDGAAESTLPDLDGFGQFLREALLKLPVEVTFTLVDLLRVALADPRFSGYFAEEKDHKTISALLSYVNSFKNCPYSLRLVTLQTACNLFSSPLYPSHILGCPTLTAPIVQLIAISLLDDKHQNVRVAAASLCFNIASTNSKLRTEEYIEVLPEGEQVELAASLLEAISAEEESPESLKGFLFALGYLVFCAPKDGELIDLLKIMDAKGTVAGKVKRFPDEKLVIEITEELLGKGII